MSQEQDWEARLFAKKDAKASPSPTSSVPVRPIKVHEGAHARYAAKALADEVAKVDAARIPTDSVSGNRNDTLNTAAFNMGQLVGAGVIDEATVCTELAAAAKRRQMNPAEIAAILPRSVREGAAQPRTLPQPIATSPADDSWIDKVTGEIVDQASTMPSQDEQEAFWDAREELRVVRQMARARMVGPWTTLGCVLAHVITAVPPEVVLPPLVGGHGSLNLFVGVVGPSGKGKGASGSAARDAVTVDYDQVNLGTGEGIVAAYIKPVRGGGFETVRRACLFNVAEIDTLTAVAKRQGATVLPVLRSAWSGEPLGFQNADAARRLHLQAHDYRLTLIAGIQPGRAEALLGDSDGGTPQRFMWLPAEDADACFPLPAEPKPYTWPGLGVLTADAISGRVLMRLAPIIGDTVRAERMASLRGEDGDRLGGHDTFARVKVAAALAVLNGRLEVTDDDWELSSVLHRVSLATRGSIQEALSRSRRAKNQAAGIAEAERVDVVEEQRAEKALRRVSRWVLNRIRARGPQSAGDLRRAAASYERPHIIPAIDRLLAAGSIEAQMSESGAEIYAAVGD